MHPTTVPFSVQAWHPYISRNDKELSLEVGKVYVVNKMEARGAWFGHSVMMTTGVSRTLWFPASYTLLLGSSIPILAPTENHPLVHHLDTADADAVEGRAALLNSTGSAVVLCDPSLITEPPVLPSEEGIDNAGLAGMAEGVVYGERSLHNHPHPYHRDGTGEESGGDSTTSGGEGENGDVHHVGEGGEGEGGEMAAGMAEEGGGGNGGGKTAEESQHEKALKDAKQRQMTIQEIVTTEFDYVRDLEILVNMSKVMSERKILSPEVMSQIFSNVIVLHGVNKSIVTNLEKETKILEQLPEGKEKNIDKLPLGKIFSPLAPFLKMYLSYCDNHDNALIVLSKHIKKNKNLEQFIIQQAESPECKGLYLKDYLIKPIQRLCKYPLLFQNLIKITPENDSDYKDLKDCLDKINTIVREINEIRDKNVNFLSLFQYEERLVDYHSTLLSRQRKFIREGVLSIIDDKRSRIMGMRKSEAQERVVLVFNDRILFCKRVYSLGSRTNQLKFSSEMSTEDMKIIDTFKEHPEYDISFMLETHSDTQRTRMVFTETPKDKNTWLKLLQETVHAAKADMFRREEEDPEGQNIDISYLDPEDPNKFGEKDVRALVPLLLGPKGIAIKNRKMKLKTYKNCFTGKDLIQWLMTNGIKERSTALKIGQKFIDFGYVKHASENDPVMRDDGTLYRFDAISMDQDKRTRSTSGKVKGQLLTSNEAKSKTSAERKNTFGKPLSSSHGQSLKTGSVTRKMALSPQRGEITGQKAALPDCSSNSSLHEILSSPEIPLCVDVVGGGDPEDTDYDTPLYNNTTNTVEGGDELQLQSPSSVEQTTTTTSTATPVTTTTATTTSNDDEQRDQ